MKKRITRSQIKEIGKRLREAKIDDSLSTTDLEILKEWRTHHGPSLRYFSKFISNEAKKMAIKDFTLIQRIKRIHSIIVKLKRFPEMQLSMMDDIAGARIILPENENVFALVNALKARNTKHELVKVKNYIMHPKKDGYRGVHIVYKIEKSPAIQIEIQFRSLLQHYFATGVEVFGTLENTSFKTGEGAEEWKEFFKLLSSRFALKEGMPVLEEHEIYTPAMLHKKLVALIRKLNIIEQLTAYTSVYSSNWRDGRSKGRSGKYALITLNNILNTTDVEIFSEANFEQALDKYTLIEKDYHSSDELNVVLVNLDNVENIEKAYPNYFMDTKVLMNYLSQIVLNEF